MFCKYPILGIFVKASLKLIKEISYAGLEVIVSLIEKIFLSLTEWSVINRNGFVSPRPVDKEEKKKLIVNAALQVIKTKGFAEATVEEIATIAKIGKGTVYEYFSSKEEIVQKLVSDFFSEQENRFKEFSFQSSDPEKAIKAFLQESFFDIETLSDIIPIHFEFWSSGKGKALGLNKSMSERFERMAVRLNQFLREGKKQNVFIDSLDTKNLATVIISSIDGLILYHALFKPRKEMFQKKVNELEKMIIGYIRK